jgi:oligoribonuclease
MSDIPKGILPTRLLWVDLEMTGLRPETDIILEVAAVVTDFQFNEIARYESEVNYAPELVGRLLDENPWYADYPENKAHFLALAGQGKDPAAVEAELTAFTKEHFGDEPAVLAGNSIHNDRNFIRHWWPAFDETLHYRMLDVSAWKVWMQGAYSIEYQKSEAHRASGDIAESIAELQYYLDWFAKKEA